MDVIIEIGELKLAAPAFRTKSRLIAITNHHQVCFALQYQHDGEPGVWLSDPSFPWVGRNFDSIIRAAVRYHKRIEGVLKQEKEMYKVTIVELFNATEVNLEKEPAQLVRYEQIVDELDMQAVINAVNSSRPQFRQRALRSDAGKPRKLKDALHPYEEEATRE